MRSKFIFGIFLLCQSLAAQAGTGFLVRSFSSSPIEENVATILETIYVGQCPGVVRTTPEAWFASETVSKAESQRVKIENISPGMRPDPYPYTDRAYWNGKMSEHTWLQLDSKHRGRTFSVKEGENNLRYLVYVGRRIVEQGTFSLDVKITKNEARRDMQCRWETRCRPSPNGGSVCSQEWECRCPYY
jgi:hypothetical protein